MGVRALPALYGSYAHEKHFVGYCGRKQQNNAC